MTNQQDGRSPADAGSGHSAEPEPASAVSSAIAASTPNAEAYERLFDATVRIEEAWPFPMSPTPERLIEALADNMGRLPAPLAPYFAKLSEYEREALLDGGWEAEEGIAEIAGNLFRDGVFGWLALAATPVFTPTGTGSASFSWGHYHTALLFAPTGDALLAAVADWADQIYAEDTASGIEAATADETQSGSAVGESPAAESRDAQGQSV